MNDKTTDYHSIAVLSPGTAVMQTLFALNSISIPLAGIFGHRLEFVEFALCIVQADKCLSALFDQVGGVGVGVQNGPLGISAK